jgi:hypothetical protein
MPGSCYSDLAFVLDIDQAHYGNRVWPNWIDQTNPNPLPHLRFA